MAKDTVTRLPVCYRRQVEDCRLLSKKEEHILGLRAIGGDVEDRNLLVLHNQRFLMKMVNEFYERHRNMEFEDLVQEANIGLIKAAEKFNPEKGVRFISYARFWIRQALNLSLEQSFGMVRIPTNRVDDLIRIRKTMNKTGETDPQALSKAANVPEETVRNLLPHNHPTVSLDSLQKTHTGEEGEPLMSCIGSISVEFDRNIEIEELKSVLNKLPESQRDILMFRYGLFGHPEMTLKELSDKFGVSREAIRQMENRALSKCREVA